MSFICLLCSIITLGSLEAGIKVNRDYFVEQTKIPAGSDIILLGTDTGVRYQLLDSKRSVGFVTQDCVSIQGEFVILGKDCPIYDTASSQLSNNTISAGRRFKQFLLVNTSTSKIMYGGKRYEVPSDILRFVMPSTLNAESYDPVSIEAVVKLSKEKAVVSPYIDKAMYVSTQLGVFASFDAKKWYRLKKLEARKYEIAVTQDGWLVADTLVSRDFGRNFEEFFPSYALPYKDTSVKGILISPHGVNAVYLTLSSTASPSDITLYMLTSQELGWRKIYPAVDGSMVTVPVEDTFTSILKFINNKWLKAGKHPKKGKVDIEDIELGGKGAERNVSIMVTTVDKEKKNYHVSLQLSYTISDGWKVLDEKWSLI